MATMRLRFVHSFVDKTGRVRFYFRHRGKRWPLPGQPGSVEFGVRYDELRREQIELKRPNNVAFGPNSLGAVIEKYLSSEEFQSKASGTRKKYLRVLDRLKEIAGRGLIVDLQEKQVREIRKRFLATSTADLASILLSIIWVFVKKIWQ
jgi:hypothetical protein